MPANFFELERRSISLCWFWPSPELMSRKDIAKMLINTILMAISLTGEVNFASANWQDLPIALNALGPVFSKFSATVKVWILFYYQEEVRACLAIFKRMMDKGKKL